MCIRVFHCSRRVIKTPLSRGKRSPNAPHGFIPWWGKQEATQVPRVLRELTQDNTAASTFRTIATSCVRNTVDPAQRFSITAVRRVSDPLRI